MPRTRLSRTLSAVGEQVKSSSKHYLYHPVLTEVNYRYESSFDFNNKPVSV